MIKFVLRTLVCLIGLLGMVEASLDFDIINNNQSYQPGDFVNIGALIRYTGVSTINLVVEESIQWPISSGTIPVPVFSEVEIAPGEEKLISEAGFYVMETMPEGEYAYAVRMMEGSIEYRGRETFMISGTLSEFGDMRLKACYNPACRESDLAFDIKEIQKIYLKVEKGEDAELFGTVFLPGGGREPLQFLGGVAEIRPSGVGKYTAQLTASKQGYLPRTIESTWDIIEFISPIDGNDCTLDGLCNNGENVKNCPQDCRHRFNYFLILIPALMIVLIIIIVARKRSGHLRSP